MSKIPTKALLAAAVILSVVTAGLIYSYLKGATTAKAPGAGVPVVVAKMDLTPKMKITPEMVQEQMVPPEYIQPGAMKDLKSVVGVVVREKVVAGEQITERRLLIDTKSAGFTGLIPKDKRAITVAVTDVSGVAGFVKAGDYVDVVVTFDKQIANENVSNTILQNILVLAANRDTEAPVAASESAAKDKAKDVVKLPTVTMAVQPVQAARLALAEDKGKIRLILKPWLSDNTDAVPTKPVVPEDLVGKYMPQKEEQVASAAPAPAPAAVTFAPAPGRGVTTIRGTKVETVPVN